MREILFRGKSTDFGDWLSGYIRQYENGKVTIYDFENKRLWFVDPSTVGEFTGLTDKNGKKIFEGDMCRVTRPCVLAYGKITFQNGCFWFVDDGEGGMLRLCDVKINGFQIEVIGNIHDNPDIIE